MGTTRFQTVADELLVCATTSFKKLRERGYRVRSEVPDAAAPFTPTITAVRASTTLHVDVVGHIDPDRIRDFVSYARSSARDTRFGVCIPEGTDIARQTLALLRSLGVGLFLTDG